VAAAPRTFQWIAKRCRERIKGRLTFSFVVSMGKSRNSSEINPVNEKVYYHGTDDRLAYAIMTQGFKIGELRHGSMLGRGLYIAQQLDSVVFWSHDITITCRLQKGTRILWLHEGYDRKLIRHLEKEFGRELLELGPDFQKAIPSNKKLTKSELIALCNYVFETRREKRWRTVWKPDKGKRAKYWGAWSRLSLLHDQVRRHQFDGLGDRTYQEWDSDQLLIFNPSRVVPISAHWLHSEDGYEVDGFSEAIDLDELKVISDEAQEVYERDLDEEIELE
jgi:hypothetical protein